MEKDKIDPKKLIFIRCFCRSKNGGIENTKARLNSIKSRFIHKSEWMSSLLYSISHRLEKTTYVIIVGNDHHSLCCDEYYGNVNFKVCTESQINQILKSYDIIFSRNYEKISIPKDKISLFYAASKNSFPQSRNNWTAILSCYDKENTFKWIKGCSSEYWHPSNKSNPEYDFVCLGRPGKSTSIINKIAKSFPEKKILVTGIPSHLINHKNIKSIPWINDPIKIRQILQQSKWGIASTCPSGEGFPMSIQLEYSLCGLPYVYDNNFIKDDRLYVRQETGIALNNFNIEIFNEWKSRSIITRNYAVQHLSSVASADSLWNKIQKIK